MKLSDFDKKILFELDKDGRVSLSDIARTLKTTPQVVKYHYEQLVAMRYIDKFWAFIDYDRAGYSFFWGYWFKLSGMNQEEEEAMYADLRHHRHVPIVMRCDGYADMFIGIIAEDIFQHNKLLQTIFEKYGNHITTSDIVVGLGFVKFPRTYLIGEENSENSKALSGGSIETSKLSELDRKILSILQLDGRADFTKIAKMVGSSANVVQKHYHKLCKNNVITKITYTPNYEALGLILYRVLFKIVQFKRDRVDELYLFCEKNPNIINYVKVMGSWQLMLDVEVENRTEVRNLLRTMKQSFQDIIFQIEINEVYKIDKFTQMAIEYPDLKP